MNVGYNVYAPKAERSRVTSLNHGQFIRSDHSSICHAARARLLGHVITEQRCEIQSV